MSSTPSAHPAMKLTVTVVDGRVHPVVTNCMEPVVTSRVHVWPASSESVRVPGSGLLAGAEGDPLEHAVERPRAARRGRGVEVHGGRGADRRLLEGADSLREASEPSYVHPHGADHPAAAPNPPALRYSPTAPRQQTRAGGGRAGGSAPRGGTH